MKKRRKKSGSVASRAGSVGLGLVLLAGANLYEITASGDPSPFYPFASPYTGAASANAAQLQNYSPVAITP